MAYAIFELRDQFVGVRMTEGELLALERYRAQRRAESRSHALRLLIKEFAATEGKDKAKQPRRQVQAQG